MPTIQRIVPCLWFDRQAEEAARHYVEIFPNSRIGRVSHYTDAGREIHGGAPGAVLTVEFELDGQTFTALNGGPIFQFSPAVSLQVMCETQEEIDYYWDRLSVGGDPVAQQCGWVADKYGLSWQIVPNLLADLLSDWTTPQARKTMEALLKMQKLDIEALQAAAS